MSFFQNRNTDLYVSTQRSTKSETNVVERDFVFRLNECSGGLFIPPPSAVIQTSNELIIMEVDLSSRNLNAALACSPVLHTLRQRLSIQWNDQNEP